MSAYTAAPVPYALVEGRRYVTTAPIPWEVGREGSGLVYTVPAGVTFDLTIPPGLRWIVSPHDPRCLRAAALHDHMLEAGWSRLSAGAEFGEALRADGMRGWRLVGMWLAVSVFRWGRRSVSGAAEVPDPDA